MRCWVDGEKRYGLVDSVNKALQAIPDDEWTRLRRGNIDTHTVKLIDVTKEAALNIPHFELHAPKPEHPLAAEREQLVEDLRNTRNQLSRIVVTGEAITNLRRRIP